MWPAQYFHPTNQILIFTKTFQWKFPISNFTKIQLLEAQLIYVEEQADMAKLTDALCEYLNATRKGHTQKYIRKLNDLQFQVLL